eukprot:c54271_g1_i1 orf=13-237(+)
MDTTAVNMYQNGNKAKCHVMTNIPLLTSGMFRLKVHTGMCSPSAGKHKSVTCSRGPCTCRSLLGDLLGSDKHTA